MTTITRMRRRPVAVAAALVAVMSGAPAAVASELPPPPVVPGFEHVVIDPRPLAAPDPQPAPATTAYSGRPTAGATTCSTRVRIKGHHRARVTRCGVVTPVGARRH